MKKEIEKLNKKAIKIDKLDIPQEKIKSCDLEEFMTFSGDIYKYAESFLTSYKGTWYCFDSKKEEKKGMGESTERLLEEMNKEGHRIVEIRGEKKKELNQEEIMDWCKKLKEYTDIKMDVLTKELEILKVTQEELVKELKDYIDNKVLAIKDASLPPK